MLEKRIDSAFGKKVFLLGIDEYEQEYWLKESSWDCNWYWGFGYIFTFDYIERKYITGEEYQRRLNYPKFDKDNYEEVDTDLYCKYINYPQHKQFPRFAEDIGSHQHANDFYPKWWLPYNDKERLNSLSCILKEVTFTIEEGWILSELFSLFYKFKSIAEIYHKGNSGFTSHSIITDLDLKNKEKEDEINQKILPQIFQAIYTILTSTHKEI